jgi:hypothetical protein
MQSRLLEVTGRVLTALAISALLIRPLELAAQRPFVASATVSVVSLSHNTDPDSSRFLLLVKIANLPYDSLATKHLKLTDVVVADRDGVTYTPKGFGKDEGGLAAGNPSLVGRYVYLVTPKNMNFELRLPGDTPKKFVAAVSLKP